ncbi:MAG: heavy-metal-associated domain-containing protein [Saprospiraceae bacterium]|jgi:copper chaperone CopZ|nr:heavy-metal-associated domain-containing protein [Saprospiraceae bacterium]MBP9209614.1 heavy-metal-associated domain-containing protein [Saprospiraceae bacterium]
MYIPKIFSALILFALVAMMPENASAQFANEKSDTVRIYGNCEMCKRNIERAGKQKKTSSVTWEPATQLAVIRYDSAKTSLSTILRGIAAAGYDSDDFRAPDDVYQRLHTCCQYERPPR